MKKRNYLSAGQTLLEAIVAIGVLAIVLTAAATAVVNSINNANFSNNQNLANKYAQDTMEYIRNLEGSNYPAFEGLLPSPGASATYCMPQQTALPPTGPGGTCDCAGAQCITANTGILVRELNLINNNDIPTPSPRPCEVDPVGPETTVHGTLVTVNVKWSSGKCSSTDRFCHITTLQTCVMPPI